MSIDELKPFITWLHLHPHVANIFTFLVAFAESIAIVGLVIPGSMILLAIGTLVGSGVLHPSHTILFAICGAITGDFLSYWIGHVYRRKIHSMWPFKLWPNMLHKGEEFFARRGAVGVFLGRFIGPIRPITPLVAGIMKMQPITFICIDVISAILWALLYIVPGIFVGNAASSELSPDVATHFILAVCTVLLVCWAFYWIFSKILSMIAAHLQQFYNHLWHIINHHRKYYWIKSILYSPAVEERSHQLGIFFLFVFSFLFLCCLSFSVVHHGWLTHWNQPVYFFFRNLRSNAFDTAMILITFMGEKLVLIPFVVAIALFLWFTDQRRAAKHWVINGAAATIIAYTLKHNLKIPRPLGIKGALAESWSYPSGHVTLATAVFGFLVVLLSQHLPHRIRNYFYLLTVSLIGAIFISRLYLGAHWLTDATAGLCIGLCVLSLVTISYRREMREKFKALPLLIVALVTFALFYIGYATSHYAKAVDKYTLTWRYDKLTVQEWWEQNGNDQAPLYRYSRFGQPIQTLNIQWLAPVDDVRNLLINDGWQSVPDSTVQIILARIKSPSATMKFPYVASLYQAQIPLMTFYKYLSNNHSLLILRLWDSQIQIVDSNQPLLVGAVYYYRHWRPAFMKKHKPVKVIPTPGPEILAKEVLANTPFTWRFADFHNYPPLNNREDDDWHGRILLVKSKN